MTAIKAIMAFASLCWLVGCAPIPHLSGHWLGHRSVDAKPGADPAIVEGISKVELKIDDRGHFVLFESGIPKTGTISGDDDNVTLNVLEVAGRKATATAKSVRKEGTDLVYRDSDLPNESVTLKARP